MSDRDWAAHVRDRLLQRAIELGRVVQDADLYTSNSMDAFMVPLVKGTRRSAVAELRRLGFGVEHDPPMSAHVVLVPVRASSRARAHVGRRRKSGVRRLGFLESAEGRPMSVYNPEG